jgi:hypothetical protein
MEFLWTKHVLKMDSVSYLGDDAAKIRIYRTVAEQIKVVKLFYLCREWKEKDTTWQCICMHRKWN